MKHLKTLITLFLLMIGTGMSWAGVTCTWDFTNSSCPAGNVDYEYSGVKTGTVASDVEGVELYVDASADQGKFNSVARASDVQINAPVTIKIPVKTNNDRISIYNYPGYGIAYKIGIKNVSSGIDEYTYSVTTDDASKGYAILQVTEGVYVNKIVVTHSDAGTEPVIEPEDETVPERIAKWDWENDAKPGKLLYIETNIKTEGNIHSNIPGVVLEAIGTFLMTRSGRVYPASLSEGAKVRVPVRRANDVVTVTCGSGYHNYKIGANATSPVTSDKVTYTATVADAELGYVEIVSTGDTRFFSIAVQQMEFSSALPMIMLNAAGWASFTSLVKDCVVSLPAGATAYVATDVSYECDKGTVTLTEVERFAYGEGIFVKGDPGAQVYAKITTKGGSDVPTEGNLTIGCTENTPLFTESGAYVVATDNSDKKNAGFFRVVGTVTVPAGKAYLFTDDTTGAKSLDIVFADGSEATGIESVVEGAKVDVPTVFYNLSGQQVGNDYKGIVVGNDGKKYLK